MKRKKSKSILRVASMRKGKQMFFRGVTSKTYSSERAARDLLKTYTPVTINLKALRGKYVHNM